MKKVADICIIRLGSQLGLQVEERHAQAFQAIGPFCICLLATAKRAADKV